MGNCGSPLALDLLAKDQDDLLQPFQQGHTDLLETALEIEIPVKTLERSKLQSISLVRGLLEFSGGRVECRQHAFDQEYTASDNISLCGILIGITGTNRFGNFDSQKMYNALLKSKIFAEDSDISALDTVKWSIEMMNFLPIGFSKGYLVRHPEGQAWLILMVPGASVAGVKRFGFRAGGFNSRTPVTPLSVNTKEQPNARQ